MADAREQLESLKTMLTKQREQYLENLAAGRTDDKHWELVGQCKALKWTIEQVQKQIKSINGDPDGDSPL